MSRDNVTPAIDIRTSRNLLFDRLIVILNVDMDGSTVFCAKFYYDSFSKSNRFYRPLRHMNLTAIPTVDTGIETSPGFCYNA